MNEKKIVTIFTENFYSKVFHHWAEQTFSELQYFDMAKIKGSGGLEVICAGFPKTGTKSLYEALKIMGYKHYEVPDIFTHMLDDWLKFLKNEADFSALHQKYLDHKLELKIPWASNGSIISHAGYFILMAQVALYNSN